MVRWEIKIWEEEMQGEKKQATETYLKLDESVHGSIDMDVNRETFK